jgi:3-hydroxyisobutyrate dehydrogenase
MYRRILNNNQNKIIQSGYYKTTFNRKFSGSTSKQLVGFIGLGNMGSNMANNLIKNGYNLVVHDVNELSLKNFVSNQNVKIAKSPKEVASQVDLLITMLPSSPHVQEVYTGVNGILSSVRTNSLLIDTSTIDPGVAREVASKVADHKATMIDAPVSGGVGGAQAGTLTFMVGGEKEAFEKAKILLQCMGKNIVHCGGTGNGQVVKVCNNLVLAISMIGVSEAMNLGMSLGMDPKVLAGIFNTSSARCWSSDTYNPVPGVMENVPASRGYNGGFGVDLMAKDVGLAVTAANKTKAPLPLGGQALQIYNLLSNHGYANKDFASIFEFLHTNTNKQTK